MASRVDRNSGADSFFFRQILKKVNRLMMKVAKKAKLLSFVQIPEFPSSSPRGGIESRRIMEQLNQLAIGFDAQANHLDEWREKTIKLLLRPLVDEDEGIEITGDEYEESTKTQDEVLVLVQVLRTVIEDRYDALTGQENLLVSGEVKTARKLAEEGEGPFPEKFIELFKAREQIKLSKEHGSIRGIVSDLRAISTTLKLDAENGNSRAANELSIVEQERQRIQKQYSEQSKVVTALRQEVDLFTTLMNTRLEYYRQLQQLSDMVKPLEDAEKAQLNNMEAEEERLTRKIATSSAKRRYLIHLQDETTADSTQQRMCIICQSNFQIGALTVCGHQFCKECMGLWWSAHRNCPVCKRNLTRNDLHDITYKPQELKMSEEVVDAPLQGRSPTASAERSAIYSEINNSNTFAQIKNIDLDGPSFTTKISTLARHLLWLREQVFSLVL
jgi:E3 ubiquitin-protein ligase SHPRH